MTNIFILMIQCPSPIIIWFAKTPSFLSLSKKSLSPALSLLSAIYLEKCYIKNIAVINLWCSFSLLFASTYFYVSSKILLFSVCVIYLFTDSTDFYILVWKLNYEQCSRFSHKLSYFKLLYSLNVRSYIF